MKQLGCISRALCWVKETGLKRLYTAWIHLYDIPKKTNSWWWKQISGCQRLGAWGRCYYKEMTQRIETFCILMWLDKSIHMSKFRELYTIKVKFYCKIKHKIGKSYISTYSRQNLKNTKGKIITSFLYSLQR